MSGETLYTMKPIKMEVSTEPESSTSSDEGCDSSQSSSLSYLTTGARGEPEICLSLLDMLRS